MEDNKTDGESIIRQHRRWTRWVVRNREAGIGNLILTNRRLLFLHRISSSPEVKASIKQLADAPMEQVLDHALTLHKYNFQIPLTSIIHSGLAVFFQFPFPHFCLRVSYMQGKKMNIYSVSFQFLRTLMDMVLHPQFIEDISWSKSIDKAIRDQTPKEEDSEN